MSTTWLPCGTYHQNYSEDQSLWQTTFIKGKMILLFAILFLGIPLLADSYWLSVCNTIGYTILGALGVQLLIGFCGQVTLGHAAFIAVGAYTSTLLILEVPWPPALMDLGIAYCYCRHYRRYCIRNFRPSFSTGQRLLSHFDYHGRAVYHS